MDDEFSSYAAARWDSLVRAAVFMGSSPVEAQDLAQVTLLRCYLKWTRVSGAGDRDAYVYRILVNCMNDSRRRRWWSEQAASQLPDDVPVDASGRVETEDAIERAMSTLNRDHRDVVVLRIFVQLTQDQTASALGIPVGTVKSRLHRALAQLSLNPHILELEGRAQ
jgi:RNA polymerase sigma-70 factor (sigma-E family)